MSIFSRATGVDLLADLSEFFRSMGSAIGGVRERAEGVSALLRDQSRSAFVIVTSPELGPSREAAFLAEHLQAAGMERSAVIVNRVNRLGLEGGTVEEVRARMGEALGERLARRVASNLADHDLRSRRDARNIAQLCAEIGEREPFLVDDLDHGVQDLAGLTRVAEQLF
jgi:anion-transporting  ArsA/GET3 family ATPase